MNHSSESFQTLQHAIESLSKQEQQAVLWLIANYDIAVLLCKEKALTEQERKQYIDRSLQRDDMHSLVLLLLERIINP